MKDKPTLTKGEFVDMMKNIPDDVPIVVGDAETGMWDIREISLTYVDTEDDARYLALPLGWVVVSSDGEEVDYEKFLLPEKEDEELPWEAIIVNGAGDRVGSFSPIWAADVVDAREKVRPIVDQLRRILHDEGVTVQELHKRSE